MTEERKEKKEEIPVQEEKLPEDMSLESLLLRQRVWKTYKVTSGLTVVFQSLLAKELNEITPAATITANEYILRYLAYSIKQFGNEDWSNLPFDVRFEKIKNLPVPIVDKLIDLVTTFRNECENLLKEDIKKK
jgi:hypothetical protein